MTSTSSIGERQIAAGAGRRVGLESRRQPAARSRPTSSIIGGGIVGCSAAWFLARRGVSVVLCEKGRIAGEQSGRNWGWVRQQGRSPIELPLMMESLAIWKGLAAELGEDVGFTQGGCLYLAEDETELAGHAEWLPVAREHGLDTRLLTAGELAGVLQGAGSRWRGALYTASDGRAEPNRAAPAIARAARRAGATVITQCAVRGIERAGGRVSRVVTEHGVVEAPVVVCAAGAWTSMFSRSLGIAVPQLRVRATVARTAPAAQIIAGEAYSHRVAIRRRADGGYTVAHGSALEHDLGPATFRFAWKFLPAMRQERGAVRVRLRLGREFLDGASHARRAGPSIGLRPSRASACSAPSRVPASSRRSAPAWCARSRKSRRRRSPRPGPA